MGLKKVVKQLPGLRVIAKVITHGLLARLTPFSGSDNYWANRYRAGGSSGPGSESALAQFKAEVLNDLVARHNIQMIIEWGCGDGTQLIHAMYPRYLGLDVSRDALARCEALFRGDSSKKFMHVKDYTGQQADLSMSLDVVYHLVEDEVYEAYMTNLFGSATKLVVVYSSNTSTQRKIQPKHVKHREFTAWVRRNQLGWQLIEHIPNRYPYKNDWENGSFADFYIFGRC